MIFTSFIYKFIMYESQASLGCSIPFLDCRGYFDLAAEIVGLLLAGVVFYRAITNFKELRREQCNLDDN